MVTSIFNSFLSYLVIWYDQAREEISSITQTLQSREFGEITMAKMRLRPETPPPTHYPTRRLRRSLLGASIRPCCAIQKILKIKKWSKVNPIDSILATCRRDCATTVTAASETRMRDANLTNLILKRITYN